MAIIVIGCITRDTLIFPHAEWRIQETLGGVLLTTGILATLTSETIIPVSNVGYDVYDEVNTTLRNLPHVNTCGIQKVEHANPHTYILFASEYGTQYDEGHTTPITYSQTEPLLANSAFVLVSPMTGFDLDLRTLRLIKHSAKCPVYLDYHILALGRDHLGNRYLRRRRNWLDWCTSCDHLQMNQFEAESLTLFSFKSEGEMLQFSEPILDLGVKSIAVTLGHEGALVCWKQPGAGTLVRKIDPTPPSTLVDVTGCGDAFAAGFVVSFRRTGDLLLSYQFANRTAGLKCGCRGYHGLSNLLL